jgi:8-oxo-dGTP pyrophosphatase MutT (NUDIX family)
VRTFGEPPPGRTPRPGAYVVVVNASWDVAVVRVGDDVWLPGGGIHPGETPEDAARREVHEETGLTVELVSTMGESHEYHEVRGKAVHRLAHYYTARVLSAGTALEPDHRLEWWSPERAVELTLETERTIVRRALSSC